MTGVTFKKVTSVKHKHRDSGRANDAKLPGAPGVRKAKPLGTLGSEAEPQTLYLFAYPPGDVATNMAHYYVKFS